MNKYVMCAKEMNKVMGLVPEIDVNLDLEKLKEEIRKNAEEVVITDKFTSETWDVIEELTNMEVQRPPSAMKEKNKVKSNNVKSKSENIKTKPDNVKKRPGIIKTIIKLISENALTRNEILDELCVAFPDRKRSSMRNTVYAQVPYGLGKEKGIKVTVIGNKYKIEGGI